MTHVVGPWGFSYTGRAGHANDGVSNTGKLSPRKGKKGLRWITFDDIMMTAKHNDVLNIYRKV